MGRDATDATSRLVRLFSPMLCLHLVFATTKGVVSFSLRRGKRTWWKPSVALLGSCGSKERVLVAQGKQLLCVDAADGHIVWRVGNPLGPIESVAMAGDALILASTGGRLAALHTIDGGVAWVRASAVPAEKPKVGLKSAPPWCDFSSHRLDRSQSPVLACGKTVVLRTATGVIRAKGEWQDQISGTTDGDGVLLHEDLPIGDYPIKVDGKYDTVIPTGLTSDPDPHDQVVEGCQVEESVDEFPDCPQDILVHPREL